MRRLGGMLAAIAFAAGCDLPPPQAPYSPTVKASDVEPDKAYAAAVRVFLRKGWGFLNRDEKARAMESDWFTADSIGLPPDAYHRFSFRVIVSTGNIEIATSCGKVVEGQPKPDASGDACKGYRPDGIGLKEQELVTDILSEVNRL